MGSGLEESLTNVHEFEVQAEVKSKRVAQLQTLIPRKEEDIEEEVVRRHIPGRHRVVSVQEAEKAYAKQRDDLTDKAEDVLKKKVELEAILEEQREVGATRFRCIARCGGGTRSSAPRCLH